MSLFTDIKFLNILSSQLPLFKKKGDHLWNFRCPVCGDSRKNKTKTRGYVYRKQNNLFYKCHNCGDGRSLSNLIKFLNLDLHKQYVLEVYKDSQNRFTQPKEKPQYNFRRPTFKKKKQVKLPTIKSLPDDHYAKSYLVKRKIPDKFLSLIYYAEDFSSWVKQYDEEYKGDSDPRILIPFFDKHGNLIAAQGRAFNNTKLRYITVKVDKDSQKIYGLDRVKLNKRVYIVEGPFDSMFLDNCLAMAGSDVSDLSFIDDKVIVYDNEPRNREIIKKMEKTVQNNIPICIWPSGLNYKDINDIIVSGVSKDKIKDIIDENTFQGPPAILKLNMWKKI